MNRSITYRLVPVEECEHDWTPWKYRRGTAGHDSSPVHSMDRICTKCRCSNYIVDPPNPFARAAIRAAEGK